MKKKKVMIAVTALMLTFAVSVGTAASAEDVGGYSYLDENGRIDLLGYFAAEGAVSELKEESIDFVMTGEEAQIAFQKPLAADNFGMSFVGVKDNKLKKIEIELADAENPGENTAIVFNAMNETSSIVKLKNTNRSLIVNGSLIAENNYDFKINYDAEYKRFTDGVTYEFPILEFADGVIFPGFSSHRVNLTVHLYGESGGVFRLKEINRQRMGSLYSEDTDSPEITILNYKNKAIPGSVITLPKAFAMDVLANKASVTMTVEDPDRKTVTAVDGTELSGVTPDKDYQIKIDKNGTYRITYQATDGRNETRAISRAITVMDNEGPKIELSEPVPTSTKVGDTLKFPEVTYSDNISEETDISGWVTVKYPSGVITDVKNELKFTEEGVYEITFLAVDGRGNMSRVTEKTYAEGE